MITKIKAASVRVKHFKLKIAIVALVLVACTAMTVFANTTTVTTLVCCGSDITKVVSISDEPEDIIKKAGYRKTNGWKIDLAAFDAGSEESVIYLYKPVNVTVDDDGKKTELQAAGTVGDALKAAKIRLGVTDKLSVNRKVFLTEGMTIKIDRSFSVVLKADGKTYKYDPVKGTVQDILDKAGIILGKHDELSRDKDELLESGMKIVLKRVEYKTRTEKEVIKFSSDLTYSDEKFSDEKTVHTQGKNGESKVTYLDKYVDGKRTKSTKTHTEVIKKPVTEVATVGTKEKYISDGRPVSASSMISVLSPPYTIELDSTGRPKNYKKVITGKATAYCTGYITSTGVAPLPGRVAVDPSEIPYGTRLYIVSKDGRYCYGYAVAADTGGFTWNGSGTLIDLYMYSYSECMAFGRRDVEVYVLP